jgi:hypothetical protein
MQRYTLTVELLPWVGSFAAPISADTYPAACRQALIVPISWNSDQPFVPDWHRAVPMFHPNTH